MSTYGRNFWFANPPQGNQRYGKYAVTSAVAIGAPVKADYTQAENALGLRPVVLCDGAQAPAKECGILVYEYGPAAYAGNDPFLTTYSDLGTTPAAGGAVQVVRGTNIKVVFKNTETITFLNTRTYTARNMVGEGGGTPACNVGDYLTPQATPNDTNGYWAVTGTASNAWLVVTHVDSTREEVEARMLF